MLDGVDTRVDADLVWTIDLTTEEPAVPTRRGQRGGRGQDAWSDELTGVDSLPQRHREPAAVTEIPHRGDAAAEQLLGPASHLQHEAALIGRDQ